MKYKAIIFDLDGTLLDTLQDIANAGNAVLIKNGFPTHPVDDYRRFVGSGIEILMKRALPRNNQNSETVIRLAEEFRKEYDQHWNVTTKPYPGISKMLDELQARHLKLAVLSNKPHDFTLRCVDAFFSNWAFDPIMGYNDSIPPKPDPTGAKQITDNWHLNHTQILFLGDSGIDMKTARAAGIVPVGALWGFRSGEELQQDGAMVLLKRPQDILTLLNSCTFL